MADKLLPPVTGIDIAKGFSEIQTIDPFNQPYGEPMRMEHNHKAMSNALHRIQKIGKALGTRPIIVMEATGHYFRIVFYLFYNAGFQVVLVNPIQTKAFANAPKIRRATTDKISAKGIALLYRMGMLTPARIPTQERIQLKELCRDYWNFINQAGNWKRRLTALRDQIFLLYEGAFRNPFGLTALSIFLEYPTPERILKEKRETLALKIKRLAHKSLAWAEKKADTLKSLASASPTLPEEERTAIRRLQSYARTIATLKAEADALLEDINALVKDDPEYELLLTIPGIGPITAATILGELGEFRWFKSAGEIVAFAGIDPKVSESGKYKAPRVSMSKRGSPYLRLALYIIASAAALPKRNGRIPNPVLGAYYRRLRERGKPHKVAIGACMRKMVGYIFATLRDGQGFEVREPAKSKKETEQAKPQRPATVRETTFPVYDEENRVIAYATDAVPISRILPQVMEKLRTLRD